MPEHDPFQDGDADLNALRDAWRSLQAPEATPDADQADALTRASVDWMREAWSAIEPPVVALPASLVWRARLRTARRNAPILAAAAALVAFALFVWRRDPQVTAPADTQRIAQAPAEGGGLAQAPVEGRSEAVGGEAVAAPTPAPTVVASAPEPNAIVLEHGSVRLVLLDAGEVTTTIDHEPEPYPAERHETPAPPASPEEGTR